MDKIKPKISFHLLHNSFDGLKELGSIFMFPAGLFEHQHIPFTCLNTKTSKRQDEAINFTVTRIEENSSRSKWATNSEFLPNSRMFSDEMKLNRRQETNAIIPFMSEKKTTPLWEGHTPNLNLMV